MTQSVQSLIEQLESATKSATVDLSSIPYAMRMGWEMRKTQAEQEVPAIKDKLQHAVIPSHLIGLFASGDASKIQEVARYLSENGGIVLSARQMYQQIADIVEPAYGPNRTFNTNHFMGVVVSAERIATEANLPAEEMQYVEQICPTVDDSVSHIRGIIRKSYQDRLLASSLRTAIVDAVLKNRLTADMVPVLITDTSEDETPAIRKLLSRSVSHTFIADFEVSKESLIPILRTAA